MLNATTVTFADIVVRSHQIKYLVIFDSQVTDLALLQTALLPRSIGHTIQPDQDPIDLITQLLTQTGATKLAIVAHGQPGVIQIGNGVIDRAMLETRSGLLQEWGLDSIALYSCEVGADQGFIQRLGELTGAKIAASTSKVGAGKWELAGGMALLEIDRLAAYQNTLTVFTGTVGNDTASAIVTSGLPPIPASIGTFTGGTVANLIDGTGDTFIAGPGNDNIIAGPSGDVLNGGTGNDTLNGGLGNDTVNGDGDNDTIYGGPGADALNGGTGDDYIFSSSADDTVNGGPDNDFYLVNTSATNVGVTFTAGNAGTLSVNNVQTGTFTGIEQLAFVGFSGADTVDAALANLSITSQGAGYAALDINGAGGNDILIGSAGNDKIQGGADNDTITGNAGNNILSGGTGDDRIYVDYMRDTVDGGAGNDFLYIITQSPTDANTIIFTGVDAGKFQINGVDTGTFTNIEQLLFFGNNGNDTINANLAGLSNYVNIIGNNGSDTVLGSANAESISGDDGNDYLLGQGGNDLINGGAGFDIIFGGSGIDDIYGGSLNDTIFGGTEGDFINGNDGEDYIYGEEDNDTITGGYGFDVIYGQAGDDTIYGEGVTVDAAGADITVAPGAGVGINDTIFGGIGDDIIFGGIGEDYLYGEEDSDIILGNDGLDVIYGQAGNDNLSGDDGNDYLVGGDGADTLSGGDGSDQLNGEAGNDSLSGDDGNDFLYGNDGNDQLNGRDDNDFLDGGIGDDILRGDDGNDVLFGGDGNDVLFGESFLGPAGIDYLYGGNGNDQLSGNAGADFLIGGAGSDIFSYEAMADAGDTITDFDPLVGGDKLDLTNLFSSLGVLSGSVNANYLKFIQSGTSTTVQVDPDGLGAASFVTMATLNNVTTSQLSFAPGGNVLV